MSSSKLLVPKKIIRRAKKEKADDVVSKAHLALNHAWSTGTLPALFLKSVLPKDERDRKNSHVPEPVWDDIHRQVYPLDMCLFTHLKRFKKDFAYSGLSVHWPPGDRYGRAIYGCHRMAALIGYNRAVEVQDPRVDALPIFNDDGTFAPNWHASHWYCHHDACVNPLHLLPESNTVNQERNTCKNQLQTDGYRCPHYPTCRGLQPCRGGDPIIGLKCQMNNLKDMVVATEPEHEEEPDVVDVSSDSDN